MSHDPHGARLRLRSVSKAFGGLPALRDVCLALRPGEIHALVGENGAGKTTLVRIVTGALRADAGSVEIDGRTVEGANPALMRTLGVAPIYQQPALFPDLTVAENMAVGLEPAGLWRRVDWGERRRRARALLARVGAAIDVDALASSLGRAEQQMVEIARAVGADARIVLMDEPTAALCRSEATRLFAVMRDLRAGGVGLLYISHRLEEVAELADRVSVLRDGAVVATQGMAETSPSALVHLMVGREIEAAVPPRTVPAGEVVLQADGVGCRAEGIHDVSFQLRSGEILGLAGLVGAGRTELARVLFGLSPADAGMIHLKGACLRITAPEQAVRLGLAYVPEDRRRHGVVAEMSVAANITLACLDTLTRNGLLDKAEERRCAGRFVERLGIRPPALDAPAATLSGGNQQKVALARWLATRPAVLILDEPTQGVDVAGKAEIHALIAGLASDGVAVLLISSDLPEIMGLCDRIAVMRSGSIVGTLERARASQESILTLALGRAADRLTAPAAQLADDGGAVCASR
jgi:rhamnose transport system ATP-binding protein